MDLGESHAFMSGRSSPSSFSIRRKSVGSGTSGIPLLAMDRQDDELERESPAENASETNEAQNPPLSSHERRFSSRKQLMRLLCVGLIRWIIVIALIGGIYGTIYTYKAKTVMTDTVDKKWFNFCITSLSMLLGISIASSLKQIAVDIRWYILSRKKRPLSHVDAILNAHSLTNLVHLAFSSWKITVAGTSLSWVLINLGGQASVAVLALTYSLSPIIVPSPPAMGFVLVSNLSSFAFDFAVGFDSTSLSFRQANQLAAHTYGEMSSIYSQLRTDNTDFSINPIPPNSLHNDTAMYYWGGPRDSYFQYVFQQWSYDGDSPIGQFYSNRSIAVSTTCTQYVVKEGANGSTNDFQYQSSTGQMITRSFKLVQPLSTTYYTNAEVVDCGPRCANVCAFENDGNEGFYYECEVTFSNVTNVYDPAHVISDETARTAAGSIALQGYQTDTQEAQYQRYPQMFNYGTWLGGDNASMAARMSQFAIGAIVGADQYNPGIDYNLTSTMPAQGVSLTVDKPTSFHAILITIAAVHLVLFTGGAWLANRVVVLDESYISIANILKPLLEDVQGGSLLSGEELCDVVGKEKMVGYGSAGKDSKEDHVRCLKIDSDGVEKRFPDGWYN